MLDRRHVLLFTLYFCQGLPGGFLAVVLPVVLRQQGMSLASIGLAQALSIPWLLKITWAPLLDRYSIARVGRRRSWIIPAQLGMLATTLALGFTDPATALFPIVVGFLVLNTFAATQDVAVDGWAVDMMGEEDLGPANGAQVGGFKLGNLVGGGVLVGLLGVIGWTGDFLVMALLVAATLMLVVMSAEAAGPAQGSPHGGPFFEPLWVALKAPGWRFWALVFFAKFGETFGGALIKPMLVDNKFATPTIGWIDGTLGAIATIVGAFGGGWLVRARGVAYVLRRAALLQGLALAALGVYQLGGVDVGPFAVIGSVENLGGGAVAVCIFAAVMARADRRVGATNFTAAQVVYMAGAFAAGPLGGALADVAGYFWPLVISGLMAIMLASMASAFGRPTGSADTLGG